MIFSRNSQNACYVGRLSIYSAIDSPQGFYGAQNYSFGVLIIGIIGLVICTTVFIIVILGFINQFRTNTKTRRLAKAEGVQDLKQKFYSTLDNIEQLFEDGSLTEDGVYYEVSRALRNYATSKTGKDVRVLTRRDLENMEGMGVLYETVDLLYTPEFCDREHDPNPVTPHEALEYARTMVRRW